jgi:hypothetical protein
MKYANISKDYSELPTMQDTYCSASLSVVWNNNIYLFIPCSKRHIAAL